MAGELSAADVEGVAECAYKRAGLDTGEAADPIELAEALLGAGAVRAVHAGALPGVASLARVGATWRIYVRGRAGERSQRFAVLHELGHYLVGLDAPEPLCDAIAGALLAPRRAFQRAACELGPDWSALADRFGASESWAALRWGEVVGEPLALVAPLRVRVRGDGYVWPEPDEIRALARAPRPGLAAAKLRDDARRVVIRAA